MKVPYKVIKENGVTEISSNIVNASMVVKLAVKNAISIAGTLLTASAIVYLSEERPKRNLRSRAGIGCLLKPQVDCGCAPFLI